MMDKRRLHVKASDFKVSSQQLTYPYEVAKIFYFFFSPVSSMGKYVIFPFNNVLYGKTDIFFCPFFHQPYFLVYFSLTAKL